MINFSSLTQKIRRSNVNKTIRALELSREEESPGGKNTKTTLNTPKIKFGTQSIHLASF